MRRFIFLVASLVVSAIFLWLAVRDVPLEEIGAAIRAARLEWVALAFGCAVAALVTRGLRWRGLLDGRISRADGILLFSAAMLLNQLPLRAGDVARSALATQRGVPLLTAAASVVVERLIDTLLVVLLLAFSLSRLPSIPPEAGAAAALFGAGAVVGLGSLFGLARYPSPARRLLIWLEVRLPVIERLGLRARLDEVLAGLRPLTRLQGAGATLAWTLFGWACSLGVFYCLQRALALDTEGIDLLLNGVLGMTLASFSVAIPVSVAAIGPFEGAVRVAGTAVGASEAASVALGFLVHGLTVISYAVMGGVGLVAFGQVLGRGKRAADEPAL